MVFFVGHTIQYGRKPTLSIFFFVIIAHFSAKLFQIFVFRISVVSNTMFFMSIFLWIFRQKSVVKNMLVGNRKHWEG